MTVFTIGNQTPFSLEASYKRGFEELGVQVRSFDIYQREQAYVRLGKIGHLFHSFVPVDTWQRKVNRELALAIINEQPDLVLVFCNAPVLASTLAFIRSLATTPIVLVWPDPLLNLLPHIYPAAPLYDGVATYCRASIPVFEQLGFRNIQWVPLAADVAMHGIDKAPTTFSQDITFIGAYRPERERALLSIIQLFPKLTLKIWGTDWHRCSQAALRRLAHKRPLTGPAYSLALQQSRLSLNVIDDTCLPAANMRFFEIPIAHGLQLCSACPEFSNEYRHQESILYFKTDEELAHAINWGIERPKEAQELRENAYTVTLSSHTYRHRAQQLLTIYKPQSA